MVPDAVLIAYVKESVSRSDSHYCCCYWYGGAGVGDGFRVGVVIVGGADVDAAGVDAAGVVGRGFDSRLLFVVDYPSALSMLLLLIL